MIKVPRRWTYCSRSTIFIGLWLLFQSILFFYKMFSTLTTSLYSSTRLIFGAASISIARGASFPITIDSGLILLPECLYLLSYAPVSWYSSRNEVHKIISFSIIFWASLHTLSQIINIFYGLFHTQNSISTPASNISTTTGAAFVTLLMTFFGSIAGITGILLMSLLIAIVVFSYSIKNYDCFWWVHHIAFPFYYALLGK